MSSPSKDTVGSSKQNIITATFGGGQKFLQKSPSEEVLEQDQMSPGLPVDKDEVR